MWCKKEAHQCLLCVPKTPLEKHSQSSGVEGQHISLCQHLSILLCVFPSRLGLLNTNAFSLLFLSFWVQNQKDRKGQEGPHLREVKASHSRGLLAFCTLSTAVSSYILALRKLGRFRYYCVINLSSLSEHSVKPSNKTNYSYKQY